MIYRKKIRTNGGLIRTIVLIVFMLLILAYFGLNLREIVSSTTFIDNWNFIKTTVKDLWFNYLKVPLGYMWNGIVYPFILEPIINKISGKAL